MRLSRISYVNCSNMRDYGAEMPNVGRIRERVTREIERLAHLMGMGLQTEAIERNIGKWREKLNAQIKQAYYAGWEAYKDSETAEQA